MFKEIKNSNFLSTVSHDEIRGVLKSLAADKSPGPDDWTPDFTFTSMMR